MASAFRIEGTRFSDREVTDGTLAIGGDNIAGLNGDDKIFAFAGNDTASGNTITAGATADNTYDAAGSVLVTIAGPITRFEILLGISSKIRTRECCWLVPLTQRCRIMHNYIVPQRQSEVGNDIRERRCQCCTLLWRCRTKYGQFIDTHWCQRPAAFAAVSIQAGMLA